MIQDTKAVNPEWEDQLCAIYAAWGGDGPWAAIEDQEGRQFVVLIFGDQHSIWEATVPQRIEYVRPGERLILLDQERTEVTVRGRDRAHQVKWKIIALIWIAASAIHLLNHWR